MKTIELTAEEIRLIRENCKNNIDSSLHILGHPELYSLNSMKRANYQLELSKQILEKL